MKKLLNLRQTAPASESELLERCYKIEGLSFSQLSRLTNYPIPRLPVHRKGWLGRAIELILGSDAGTKPQPDFTGLGIELKTIPLNHHGNPAESTFITSISLLTIQQETWTTSCCYSKLRRVLWVPIEGDQRINYPDRRIGCGHIWSPSAEEETALMQDWQELTNFITLGKLAEINSSYGQCLQIRPKANNARSLCYSFDENGNKQLTLPRGFYLRTSFTAKLLRRLAKYNLLD